MNKNDLKRELSSWIDETIDHENALSEDEKEALAGEVEEKMNDVLDEEGDDEGEEDSPEDEG